MSDWFHTWNLYYFPGRAFYPADSNDGELPPEFRLENRDLRIPRQDHPGPHDFTGPPFFQ